MKTKINRASSSHGQVRTTVPSSIAELLKLEVGDELDWEPDKINGEWVVIIKKAKKE